MARRLANLFRVAVASTPSNTYIKAAKGVNFMRCWRHASSYIRFFPLSASCRYFSGVFTAWVLASVFTTRMSWTLSVPFYQRSRISRYPFCSVASGSNASSWSVETPVLAGLAFGLFTAQPAKMRGVVVHVRGSEGFSGQVYDPVPDLIMTCRDKATPIAVQGMANGKFGVVAVTVFGEVWGI